MQIGKLVTDWYAAHGRHMPWREGQDPYRIWVSEVIMQQTRIEQGEGYFYRFVDRFPDLASLAAAEQDEVLKYWEGLGYYSRARNLHAAARQLVETHGGQFPSHHEALLTLKGVGPYTARAIASFAFGQQVGVLDGNVLRVMSRLLNDFSPVNRPQTRRKFQHLIDGWVAGQDSRSFNYGMMDIGATICTPTQPGCLICPLEAVCQGRKAGSVQLLPQKDQKLKRKVRYFNFYLILNEKGEVAIRQRPTDGFWGGLWEIPNEETKRKAWEKKESEGGGRFLFELKHVFTHFDMMINTFMLSAGAAPAFEEVQFISTDKIAIFAFSKAVLNIFENAWQNMD